MEEQEDEVTCQDHILTSKWLTLCYPDSLGEIINFSTDPYYIVAFFFSLRWFLFLKNPNVPWLQLVKQAASSNEGANDTEPQKNF